MDNFHDKKRKICDLCDKSCNNLETHMDKFHNKKRIICDICDKSCINLEKHMEKYHTKKKREFCNSCGYLHSTENSCKFEKLKMNSDDMDPLELPTVPKTYSRFESQNPKIHQESEKEAPNLFTLLETHKCDSCDKLYFTEAAHC